MRYVLTVAVGLLLVLGTTLQAEDAPEEIVKGMGKKFVRGAVNTVTGIVELPVQTVKGYKNGLGLIKNKPLSKTVGTVLGFFRGIGHAAGRTLYGVVDMAAFWAANPESNEGVGIPLDAEYAWEEGQRYSIFKPNLKEGLMPYPRKIVRGLGNGLLGSLKCPARSSRAHSRTTRFWACPWALSRASGST